MSNITVKIKPQKTLVSTIQVGPRVHLNLGDILDVNASDPDMGETLVYDANTHQYIVKPIVVDSNNIPNINCGTF